jgi:hypothetical protein
VPGRVRVHDDGAEQLFPGRLALPRSPPARDLWCQELLSESCDGNRWRRMHATAESCLCGILASQFPRHAAMPCISILSIGSEDTAGVDSDQTGSKGAACVSRSLSLPAWLCLCLTLMSPVAGQCQHISRIQNPKEISILF